MDHRFNRFLRATLLGSRWGMAPFFLGLIAALLLVMAQFFRDLAKAVLGFPDLSSGDVMVVALKLIDLVLVANLILLIVTAGIATFAPRPADADSDVAQLGGIADFAELKLKVFASIAAIAGVDLLEHVIYIDTVDKTGVLVRILVLLAFVAAGLALAWMDRLAHRRRKFGEVAMTRMTGGRALVEMLTRHGVDTLFALPGVQNDALFVALYDAGEAIRVIHPRHEQAAAYMAFGYARAIGKPGAFAVVPGPGLLNTTAAIATAYATNTPVLCISGQIPSNLIGRGFGLLHEIPDQLSILRGLTKWAERINHPSETGGLVNEAFRQLGSGRPRPVALEMPLDIMALESEVALPAAGAPPTAPPPDPELISQAAKLLAAAKQPMIYVGSGCADAAAEVLAVAEALQAPVVTYTGGKGIVSDRHYLAQNLLAGHDLWRTTDVVLAVGTRFNQPQTRWGFDSDLKVIRIDLDPVEITRIARPAIGIVGDAKDALIALGKELAGAARASRRDELDALKGKTSARLRETLGPQCEYLDAIRAELPDDGIYVEDLTQVGYVGRLAFPVYRPRTYIHSGYQGTLGFSYATALGAKVARPDVPVVSVSGDGGFMYNVQELSTAALHGIDAVAIVFADGAYGNVRRMQKNDYGNRLIGVDLLNPNFPKMAESFGIAGVRAMSPAELRRELAAALKRRGPTLIEVPVGEMPDPWPTLMMPRVRGR